MKVAMTRKPKIEDRSHVTPITAKDRLWQVLDGRDSRLISLRNRLVLLEHLFEAKVESEGSQHAEFNFAVLQLADDLRRDEVALTEELQAASVSLDRRPARKGAAR
jgi:hypothetical protein